MFGRRKEQDQRLLALETVLQETRLTLDGMFLAMAGVLARSPDIAETLRTAAECMAAAPLPDTDADGRSKEIASREHSVSLLIAMAQVVDTNLERAGRCVIGSEAGVQ